MSLLSLALKLGLSATSGISVPTTPYLGGVGTRAVIADNFNIASNSMRGIRHFYLKRAQDKLAFGFGNWLVEGFATAAKTYTEIGIPSGTDATVTAWLYDNAGASIGQVLWSGATSVVIPTNTQAPLSDFVTPGVAMQPGWYAIRYYFTSSAGVLFLTGSATGTNIGQNRLLADNFDNGTNLVDNTAGGAYTASSGSSGWGPNLIVNNTTAPSVCIFDDSLGYGEHDTGDLTGDVGFLPRAVGGQANDVLSNAGYAYGAYCIGGDSVNKFLASSTKRRALAANYSHILTKLGVNDYLVLGRSAAQLRTDTAALRVLLAATGKKCFLGSMTPDSVTSDGGATLANQTPDATISPKIITENDIRRSNIDGWNGYLELADTVESSRNSGKWAIPSLIANTSGVHPLKAGYVRPRDMGLINASTFTYP